MFRKLTKISLLVGVLLACVRLAAQSYIVDPASIHIEETASNWQATILTGFVLSGNYGSVFYRVDLPPMEVGFPIQLGASHDYMWIMRSVAARDIAWAADRAAYACAQRFIQNRAYYANKALVTADFKADMIRFIQKRIPGVRVQYESLRSPRIERSQVGFKMVTYPAYLLHLGLAK